MARLAFTGFEAKDSTIDGAFAGVTPVVSETGAGNFYSGAASAKCNAGAGNSTSFTACGGYAASAAATTTLLIRCRYKFTNLPASRKKILSSDASFARGGVSVDQNGALYAWCGAGLSGASTLTITTGVWYRIEFQITYTLTAPSTWTNTVDAVRLNGVDLALTASDAGVSSATESVAPQAGWLETGVGVSAVCYLDDFAINDTSGSSQTSWPGDGKIVLLKTISDSAVGSGWTDDAAAATTIWDAITNTPPVGIADTTASTGLHQIRNASSATADYDANMTSYATAGLSPLDLVVCVQPMIATGAPVATAAKTGAQQIVSNPAGGSDAFPANTNQFWNGTAAGTYPTGWKISRGTVIYAPAVTIGTSPVMRCDITGGTSTRIAMCCWMGIYVEYTPVAVKPIMAPKVAA